MTLKIQSDKLGTAGVDGFAKLIDDRIAVLREYDAHEATVRQHAANTVMPAGDRWVTLAVPQSDLDAAIRTTDNPDGTHTFEPDYEIVPVPLEARKSNLFNLVNVAEADALKSVLPLGKMRAYQFREADIRKADQQRYAAALGDSPGAAIDYAAFTAEHRPITDTRFLEEQAAREDRRNEIHRWAANLHSDIEDLTDATIDTWEMKPLQ